MIVSTPQFRKTLSFIVFYWVPWKRYPEVAWDVYLNPKEKIGFQSHDFSFWQTIYTSPGCNLCPPLKRCLVGYVNCSKFAGFQNPYQTPSKATIRATPMVRCSVFWRVNKSWIKGFFLAQLEDEECVYLELRPCLSHDLKNPDTIL